MIYTPNRIQYTYNCTPKYSVTTDRTKSANVGTNPLADMVQPDTTRCYTDTVEKKSLQPWKCMSEIYIYIDIDMYTYTEDGFDRNMSEILTSNTCFH